MRDYAAVCEILDEALQQVMDVQADCAKRGSADTATQLVLMHFGRG